MATRRRNPKNKTKKRIRRRRGGGMCGGCPNPNCPSRGKPQFADVRYLGGNCKCYECGMVFPSV